METGEQQTMGWRHVANNIQSAKERELFNHARTHTQSDLQKRRAASTAVVSGRY